MPTLTSSARLCAVAAAAVLLPLGAASLLGMARAAESITAVPAPAVDEPAAGRSETAVLAGGCFWGVQGVFQHVKGVTSAVSGYAGGAAGTAHYDQVSTGTTGHAESVRVTFDPKVISYGRILQIYFSAAHDPTEVDRQGPDEGTQYRSTVFAQSAEQAKVARDYIAQLDAAHVYGGPLATTIESGRAFYPAEAHHQNFLARNPSYPYIAINDLPKVRAVQRLYPSEYRSSPVLVAAE